MIVPGQAILLFRKVRRSPNDSATVCILERLRLNQLADVDLQ